MAWIVLILVVVDDGIVHHDARTYHIGDRVS